MITNMITRPATRHRWVRSANKDEAGDYLYSFTDESTVVELQQLDAHEARAGVGGSDLAVSQWRVIFRPDVDALTAFDELTVEGVRYQFDGEPWLVRHPRTGRFSHWQGTVRKVS